MAEVILDDEGRRLLRELAWLYMFKAKAGPGMMTLAGLARKVQEVKPQQRDRSGRGADYQGLRRFLLNQVRSPHNPRQLDRLRRLIVAWLRKHEDDEELKQTPYLSLVESRGWFKAKKSTKRSRASDGDADDTVGSAGVMADMLGEVCGLAAHHFEDAAENLTGHRRCSGKAPSSADKAGFLTYRYGATPGNIVRSLTIVTPPCERHPFCWFENFYRNEGTGYSRDCAGAVVQLRDGIYMLGMLGPRDGIKLMVLPSASATASILSGLVATCSAERQPLMARVVFQRTNATSVDKLPPDVRPDAIAYAQSLGVLANEELKWRLRNHIAFEIGTEIQSSRTRGGVTAAEMKADVKKLCAGLFSLDGEPFNPAEHMHYPFNQSLLCYRPAERKGRTQSDPERSRRRPVRDRK